jgi:formiminoglutamase
MATFDIDAFDQTVAPGVSAPTADGLARELGYRAAYSAGVSSRVRSFDVSELNPEFDRDNQTARFAAMLVWHFVEGLATRKELSKFLHTQEL